MLYKSLNLVLQIKPSKFLIGMAKIQIKSDKLTPFGGIYLLLSINALLSKTIDLHWGSVANGSVINIAKLSVLYCVCTFMVVPVWKM